MSRTNEQDKYSDVHLKSKSTEQVKGRNVFSVCKPWTS